jgi:hypothetical protein
MKNLRSFVLAAVAAMALMVLAGAGSASATALYNGATKMGVGSATTLSLLGAMKITNTAETETLNECSGSNLKATTTTSGGAGIAVQSSISELTWTGCTVPTTTDTNGGLEVGWTAGTEGTVKSNAETSVTFNTIFFGVCKYGFGKGNHLGMIKSSAAGTATFIATTVAKKLSGTNFACPESEKWTFSYISTTPDNLRVEAS